MFKTRSLISAYNEQHHFSFPDIELKKGGLPILGEAGIGKTTQSCRVVVGFLPDGGKLFRQFFRMGIDSRRMADFLTALSIGLLASLLPAIQVFNINISKTLTNA